LSMQESFTDSNVKFYYPGPRLLLLGTPYIYLTQFFSNIL